MKKTLLLDIDHTLMDEEVTRPYLHEFMLRMTEKFDVGFYTAATSGRVTEICRILFHDYKMDAGLVREIQRRSLSRDNCKMIWHYPNSGGVIEIKCLKAASDKLRIPQSNILLLDDAPTWEHPHASQIVQAEGFMKWNADEDVYLKDLDFNVEDWPSIITPDVVLSNGDAIDLKTVSKVDEFSAIWGKKNIFKNTTTIVNTTSKMGRNDKCSCGSGKKFKNCCINN